MIESKNLMINNLVYWENSPNSYEICKLSIKDLECIINKTKGYEHYLPIPLDTYWITERFKIKNYLHDHLYHLHNDYYLEYLSKNAGYMLRFKTIYSPTPISTRTYIKYVHELQNLCRSLSDVEFLIDNNLNIVKKMF